MPAARISRKVRVASSTSARGRIDSTSEYIASRQVQKLPAPAGKSSPQPAEAALKGVGVNIDKAGQERHARHRFAFGARRRRADLGDRPVAIDPDGEEALEGAVHEDELRRQPVAGHRRRIAPRSGIMARRIAEPRPAGTSRPAVGAAEPPVRAVGLPPG